MFLFSLIFLGWLVRCVLGTRYASISLALPWLIAVVFGFPRLSLWPQNLYISRMKNQHGHWVYWCWVQRAVPCEDNAHKYRMVDMGGAIRSRLPGTAVHDHRPSYIITPWVGPQMPWQHTRLYCCTAVELTCASNGTTWSAFAMWCYCYGYCRKQMKHFCYVMCCCYYSILYKLCRK